MGRSIGRINNSIFNHIRNIRPILLPPFITLLTKAYDCEKKWEGDKRGVQLGGRIRKAQNANISLSPANSKFGTDSSKHSPTTSGADNTMKDIEIMESEIRSTISPKESSEGLKAVDNEILNQAVFLHKPSALATFITENLFEIIAVQMALTARM